MKRTIILAAILAVHPGLIYVARIPHHSHCGQHIADFTRSPRPHGRNKYHLLRSLHW